VKIEVNIGELNLHGFPAAQRHQVGEGVKAELARMLGDPATPSSDRRQRAAARTPERQIASAIYREIRRSL
jgi:hypothetical protein